MNRKSKRFTPNFWTRRLVPVLLAILLLALIATLIVVALAMIGVTPGL